MTECFQCGEELEEGDKCFRVQVTPFNYKKGKKYKSKTVIFHRMCTDLVVVFAK